MVQTCRNGATCEFLKKGICIFDHIPAHFEKYMGAIVKRILMVERKVQFLRRARPVSPNQQIRVRRQSKPPTSVTTHSNQNPSSKSLSAEESSPAMLVELLPAFPTLIPPSVEQLPHSLAPSAEQPTLPSPSPTLSAALLTPSPPPSNELLHPLPPPSSQSAEMLLTPTISPATPVDKATVPTRQAHTSSESTKSPVPQASPNRKRAKPPSPSQDTTSVAVTTRATEKKRKQNPQPDCSKAAQQTSTEIDSPAEETSDDEEGVQEIMPLTQREIKLLKMAKELQEFEADSKLIPKERKPQVFALLSLKKVLQKDLKRELAMEEFVGILSGYSDAQEEVREQQEEVREQQEREHLAFKASGLSHGRFYGYDITE